MFISWSFLTVERLQKRAKQYLPAYKTEPVGADKIAIQRKLVAEPIQPKPVFRLDEDRAKALAKLNKIE